MPASSDPSCRYVLPADAPYLRNLEALWTVDPALAAAVEALDDQQAYPVETSRAGLPTVAVPTNDGRKLYLHSRFEPLEEARRSVLSIDVDECIAFYLQGLGLGYQLEVLFEKASDEALFCVLEPDLRLLRTTLQQRDLSKLIQSRRVLFFTREEKSELFLRLTPHSAMMSMGFTPVPHGPSLQLHPQFHRQMQQWIAEFASYFRTTMMTLISNSQRTAENVSRNIGWYAAAAGVGHLKDRFRGYPAIVVSAGPSLRKNKHLLSSAAGKAVFVAVQTTLKPLLELDLAPQFVTSLDYHDISTRFFENLPADLTTELVAEPKATSKIFAMHPGPVSLLGNDFAESLIRELRVGKPKLPAGATVAHLAFYLAEHLGCDPIIFVGQDLGFSDGLCYAPGTSYDDVWRPELGRFCTVEMKQWEHIVRDRPVLRKITDHAGNPMYTEERLFSYLQQFERDFARSHSRIIDASEGGAAKRGAESMSLQQAVAQFCTRALPQVGAEHPGLNWSVLDQCIASLESRRREAQRIEEISRQTVPLLEEIRDHLEDQARVNRAIGQVDLLRRRMEELALCYELIMQLTQLSELRRFREDRKIAASRATGTEKQRLQVLRDIQNVQQVATAAEEFQELMDEVIAALKQQVEVAA